MQHRHLNHETYTLAAIDNVITRGKWQDWADLRRALLDDATPTQQIAQKINRICLPHAHDKTAQRYQFWLINVQHRRAAS